MRYSTVSLQRLVAIEQALNYLEEKGIASTSSEELGKFIGESAFTVRKDLNKLGETGIKGRGYSTSKLLGILHQNLWEKQNNACLVGLGNLGELLLQGHDQLFTPPITLVAGFDININKIETLSTDLPLFPLYELEQVVEKKQITVAVLAVNDNNLEEVMDKISNTAITCIINYARSPINRSMVPNQAIIDINLNKELKYVLAKNKFNQKNYGKSI